ncbi:MAG TPA: hypothetical protein VK857_02240 [Desulforhopalus sp.]|nr:hypothetical protein [Desulforhopalus sp.]
MKQLTTKLLVLLTALLLSSCGEWDDMVDSITGSGDDDKEVVAQTHQAAEEASTPAQAPAPAPAPASAPTTEDGYKNKSTYSSYGVRNGGRQAWRIPRTGPSFGKEIKVVFSNGYTTYVRNTSRRVSESNGFVFRPGIGSIDSGTGTAHNGVYLHAPYGNSSKQVTFYH